MSFFGVHNHSDEGSNLRLRDSINKIPEMIEYAHSLGHSGICFTEHESITSSLDALKYYDKHKDLEGWEGFKVVLGNEIYLCTEDVTAENKFNNRYPHFILVALNANGHKGIRELSTKAWIVNSFMHVMMRVPTYYTDLEEMMVNYKGDIVGSSACLGGALPHRLLQFQNLERDNPKQYAEIWQSCKDWIAYMNEIFGEGYFFLELQPSHMQEQIYVNQKLLQLSAETNTPYIITTDAHYLKKEDREIHKIFLESQDGDREVDDFYSTTYIMSEEEIHDYMDDYYGYDVVQKGLDNTMLIYEKAEYYKLTKDLDIPYLPLDTSEPNKDLYEKYKNKIALLKDFYESEYDCDRHLVRDIVAYIDTDEYYRTEEAYEKINECLHYIKDSSEKMKVRWSKYLLQIAIDVQIAWEAGTLVGAGRGSGVGFCLLNILGITQINPLREKTKTYPWRFLNPERASVLDIDIDICGSKRETVIQAMKDTYGEDRVSKVMTLSTEKSRSAILTAARGLKIDNDIAQYISSLIVADRGQLRTLSQMYYGDDDNPPVREFVTEMDKYPELWNAAQKIEGLVNGVGSHAGGIILVDKPFTDTTALMKTNSGDVITQFDLHMCEDCSLIKVDLLCIDALDKMQAELDLLLENKLIEWQGSLKATYEKYIGVYTLEREAEDMWLMLWNHKVMSFFQMEKESGVQAVALAKPASVDELATINSVLRLMAQEKGAESPLQKYARFRENIQYWYDEMTEYGLTQEEQDILKDIIGVSFGICEAQEYLVLLTQHPKIGGFSLAWGDRLRKAVAKKKPKEFLQLQDEFFANAKEKNLSKNLTNYVWNVLICTQRGYGFNKSHTLAYSIIGLQELNLCYKYNPIYWQTANLIVDSGAIDENAGDSTDYGKMATAIASVQKENVKVELPLINTAEFGFKADVENNRIIFGFKGINGIGDDIVQAIIQNRPFDSIEDFATRMLDTKLITNSKMVQLIKAGCFTDLHSQDREETMDWFLKKYAFVPCEKITMQQFGKLMELDIIPDNLDLAVRTVNFKKYVLDDESLYEKHIEEGKKIPKRGYHDGYYILDDNSQPFFKEHFTEDSIVKTKGDYYIVSEKLFAKEADQKIQPLKDWFENTDTLKLYNDSVYQTIWKKNADGSLPSWSMQALSFYDGEHELEHINEELYGVVNFFELPEEPEPYDYYTRYIDGTPRQMPKYKISRIAGTVINADNLHCMVTLLTRHGAVHVKFNKGHYAFYNKQISAKLDPDSDKKTVLEKSWLSRGSKIIVAGIRREDSFRPMIYKDTIYQHTVNRVQEIYEDGTLLLQSERTKV